MKFINSKTILRFLTVALVSIFSTAHAHGPGGLSGGGYKYQYTSLHHIGWAQRVLTNSLLAVEQTDLDQVTKKFTPVQFQKFRMIDLINSIRIDESDLGNRIKNGVLRKQDMDYSSEGNGEIIILLPFLDFFHKTELSEIDRNLLKRKILHELSHFFEVGINDDSVSERLSEDLLKLLNKASVFCGKSGTLEERILDCKNHHEWYQKNWPASGTYQRYVADTTTYGPQISDYLKGIHPEPHYIFKSFAHADKVEMPIKVFDSRNKIGFFAATHFTEVNYFASLENKNKSVSSEDICQRMNTFDGFLKEWRPISLDEVNLLDPVTIGSTLRVGQTQSVALKGGNFRVAILQPGGNKIQKVEVLDAKDFTKNGYKNATVICLSEQK